MCLEPIEWATVITAVAVVFFILGMVVFRDWEV